MALASGCGPHGAAPITVSASSRADLPALGPSSPRARSVAVVPLTVGRDGRMYAQSIIEGHAEGTFLIDTGSALNYISTAVRDRLHLTTAAVAGNPGRRWVSPRMSVGGTLNVRKVAFVLQAQARMPECALTRRPVDGIIGADLLSRFDVLFDAAGRRMAVWYPPGLTTDEIQRSGLKVVGTVPIAPYRTGAGVWGAKARLTGRGASTDEEMILDTGAQTTVVSHSAAVRLGLTAREGAQAIIYQSREVPVGSDRLTRLQAGDFALDGLRVCFPTDSASDCPVSLGMDVLGRRPVLVEFGRGAMFLVAQDGKAAKTQ
jgi:predicted aspartyl protease